MSESTPVAPYMAVGLSTIVHGIGERRHIERNLDDHRGRDPRRGLDHRHQHAGAADRAGRGRADRASPTRSSTSRTSSPRATCSSTSRAPRPSGSPSSRSCTTRTSSCQCKARWPEVMPDRFFNTLFVISPQGEVVHRAAKNHLWCRERSCTPHDVYDRWVELFGDGIEAFYPVLRTRRHRQHRHHLLLRRRVPGGRARARVQRRRGRLPAERGRADDADRASPAARGCCRTAPTRTSTTSTSWRRTSGPSTCTRAWSTRTTSPAATRTSSTTRATCSGTRSRAARTASCAGIVDIEALRQFRVDEPELQLDEGPAHRAVPAHVRAADPPANLWLEQDPLQHAEVDEVYRGNIERLIERGSWTPPGTRLPRLPLPAAEPQPGRRRLGEHQAALGGRVTSRSAPSSREASHSPSCATVLGRANR